MINDHTVLSAIGNAYADEILFEARIHPKTFSARLSKEETDRLFVAIGSVMTWGTKKVEEAARPIHVKVREHLKVRNRRGEPCPRCGTTIRREGVRGHDTFFCPSCQPASRKLFIDWRTAGEKPPDPD
jgi:formamidopyrimidine-DNA glycosylase